MRGGEERRAAAASQLLESCAPEPFRTAAALTRFTSPSAASGENLRGGQSSTPPGFKPSPGFSPPPPVAAAESRAGARIETGSATGETRCSFF